MRSANSQAGKKCVHMSVWCVGGYEYIYNQYVHMDMCCVGVCVFVCACMCVECVCVCVCLYVFHTCADLRV